MILKHNFVLSAVIAATVVAYTSLANGAMFTLPVEDWEIHNGTGSVSDASNSPTFTPADNNTVMGSFPDIELLNDGDYVQVNTTLTLGARTGNTGVNGLRTQLRIGLFEGPDLTVDADDTPNLGLIIEYDNIATGGLIREQTNAGQISPFVGATNIGSGTQDAGGDSLRGGTVGDVAFELKLTRNGDMIDLLGSISGTDSSNSNPYLSTYTLNGHTPAAGFNFNRVGFWFGPNADAPTGKLSNVTITTNVPEPSSCMLAVLTAVSGVAISRGARHSSRSRGSARR
jgi:hypothetical protein